ncbi:MAG: hypothetical protein ABJB66_03760 [Gemmatimonadaceae bacterium]
MNRGSHLQWLRACIAMGSLLVLGACSKESDVFSAAPTSDSPRKSQNAVAASDSGIVETDTTISVETTVQLHWNESTAISSQSGESRVVVWPTWTVRDSSVTTLTSASGMYARFSGKVAGTTYIVGRLGNHVDSLRLTVVAPADSGNTDSTPITISLSYVAPDLPATVDATYPTLTGTSRFVTAGQDLQEVLNASVPGDEIVLANGATFIGNYTLPAKAPSSNWIVVRAEIVPTGVGIRTSPTAAVSVAKVITPNSGPAFLAEPSSSNWRLVGFEVAQKQGSGYNYGIVTLGYGNEATLALQPSNIVFDRMYVHGSTTDNNSRCISLQGRSMAVIDSWVSECHAKPNDAQGICGWSGAGPYLIENNHIEGSGQAIMFGGGDPTIPNVIPSDITIRRNHLYKPISWAGTWTIKATFELKNAKRVLFEGNVLENHWADAQVGFAILFQAVSQDGNAPWSTVRDVTVRNNLVKNSTSGVNLLARFSSSIVVPTSHILIQNNFFKDVGRDPISGWSGRLYQILGEVEDVTVLNNTAVLDGTVANGVLFDGNPGVRTAIVNNVFPNTIYGVFGSGSGVGTASVNAFMPGGVLSGNVLPAQPASLYPPGNFFPDDASEIMFIASGDFRLTSTNPLHTGMYGPIGLNMSNLNTLIANVAH